MKKININAIDIFIGCCFLILIPNCYWLISVSPPMTTESSFRIVFGSLIIFILPGLIYGEIFKFKSRHILETIAISFALTLCIELLLLPAPFILVTGIKLWAVLLVIVCLVGLFILYIQTKKGIELHFLGPFLGTNRPYQLQISTVFILIILIVAAFGTYRWGENVNDIGGEKLLHMIFVRYYYSMPLVLSDLGVYRGSPPPNLINIWEYLIAGWASLVNMDPLPLFYRSRFMLPILGFSGMYFLIRNFFQKDVKAEIIFWSVLIMSVGGLMLLSPSNLDWVKSDPYRQVMAFMGTAHHADSAMDILLALNAGLFLMNLNNNTNKKTLFLLAGTLVATFMWHPREFFQTAMFAGIWGISVFVAPQVSRKAMLKKWALAMGVFLIVAVTMSMLMKYFNFQDSSGYNELAIKKAALANAFSWDNLLEARNFFNFPFHLTLSSSNAPDGIITKGALLSYFGKDWNFNLWLILAALAIPLLAVWGDEEDITMTRFYILLWFLALVWNFSMLLFIALTYSEFYVTTPRILYVFSYIMISAGLFIVLKKMIEAIQGRNYQGIYIACLCIGLYGLGYTVQRWWNAGAPFKWQLSIFLNVIILLSFAILLMKKKVAIHSTAKSAVFLPVAVIGAFVFLYPIEAKDFKSNVSKLLVEKRPSIDWFGQKNPCGFSPELIERINSLPPQRMFLVYPLGGALIPIYGPHYLYAVPKQSVTTVIQSMAAHDEIRAGKHPLFIVKDEVREDLFVNQINHKLVKEWLNRNIIDYILIEKTYYCLLPYFCRYPKDYEINFNNPDKGELIVHYLRHPINSKDTNPRS